jgi:hypothetical protein
MVNWETKGMAEVRLARYEFEILNGWVKYLERKWLSKSSGQKKND